MPTPSLRLFLALPIIAVLVTPAIAAAQTPQQPVVLPPTTQPPPPPPPTDPPPPPGWAGSLGAGWAATSGNADTSTINFAYDLLRDAGGPIVFKSAGLYLRSDSEEAVTVDRAAVDARVEHRLTPRLSAFALTAYARDRFKEIAYLVSQTVGLSYALVAPGRVEWTADAGVGVVIEKDTGFEAETDGAVVAGERFLFKANDRTRITHSAAALWKMDDFADGYYTFALGVATSLAGQLELKAEFLNTYKHKLANPDLEKNDQSIILAVVYKF